MKAKRIALLLLSVVMILSSLVIVPVSAEEATPTSTPVGYQGYSAEQRVSKEGKTNINDYDASTYSTTKEYYIVDDAGIEKLAELVTSGTNFNGKTIYLMADVKLTNPIGVYGKAFGGTFDGQGCTVDLNLSCEVTKTTYLGMFSQVNNYATIKNMVVTGSVTQTNTANATHSNLAVGAIVGVASQSVKIINVLNKANVTGLVDYAAGFVGQGHASLNITNCTNRGNVSGVKGAAGFYAYASGNISNCVNEGNITSDTRAGGIVCVTVVVIEIDNCVNKGNIVAPNQAAGIAAYVSNNVTITNCCNYGVMGHGKNGTSSNTAAIYINAASHTVTEENNLDKAIGYDADRAGWDEATLTYPTLSQVLSDATLYSGNSKFQIATPADLEALSTLVNRRSDYKDFYGKAVYLTADIDMKDVTDFKPIGRMADKDDGIAYGTATFRFRGVLDGQGKTISNLNVKVTMTADGAKDTTGALTVDGALGSCLFGWAQGATIQHLRIANSSVVHTKTGGTDTQASTGGLIAKGGATLYNVYMDVDVTGFKMTGGIYGPGLNGNVKYVTRDGKVNGGSGPVGGFVVYGGGTYLNSINLGDVASTDANGRVGGIVGRMYAGALTEVKDCVNAGVISSADATKAAAIAQVQLANGSYAIERCVNTNPVNYNYSMVTGTAIANAINEDNGHDFSDQYLGYSEAFITTSAPAGLKDISEYVSIDAATGALTGEVGSSVKAIGIKDANSMRLFSAWVNAGNTGAGKTFYLTGDIDFTGYTFTPDDRTLKAEKTFVPIGWDKINADGYLAADNNVTGKDYEFSGTFDGLGHTIKNLTLHSEDKAANYLGVFGEARNAVVRNLVVDDTCKFSTNLPANNSYSFKIGGLIGYCGGTQVTNVLVKTQIEGGATSGGFVGRGGAKGYTNCTFAGSINSVNYAGGFQAYQGASTFINCKNIGNITATGSFAAGFNSRCEGTDVFINCVNYGNITGKTHAAGIAVVRGSGKAVYSGCANYGVVTTTDGSDLIEDLFCLAADTCTANEVSGVLAHSAKDERSIEEMLTVSFQERENATEGKTDVRFITTVDSFNYQKLIYTFTLKGVTRTLESTSAYTSVVANESVVTDATSIGSDTSAYFSTLDLTDCPADAVFTVQVSVVTAGGDVLAGATWLVDLAN